MPVPVGRRRPPARRREPDPEAVEQRRARALEEPLDARLRSARPFPLLEVRNPMHGTVYLVMLPEFPGRTGAMCTCTDFARRGLGTCKHVEAALRWLGDHPGTTPLRPAPNDRARSTAVWRRVDRRTDGAERAGAVSERQRWRRVGAVLYERADRRRSR